VGSKTTKLILLDSLLQEKWRTVLQPLAVNVVDSVEDSEIEVEEVTEEGEEVEETVDAVGEGEEEERKRKIGSLLPSSAVL